MKKRSLFALLICLLLTMTLSTFVGCDRWDRLTFGTYPQTLVTDSALIGTLTSAAGELPTAEDSRDWTSYDYYFAASDAIDYM